MAIAAIILSVIAIGLSIAVYVVLNKNIKGAVTKQYVDNAIANVNKRIDNEKWDKR